MAYSLTEGVGYIIHTSSDNGTTGLYYYPKDLGNEKIEIDDAIALALSSYSTKTAEWKGEYCYFISGVGFHKIDGPAIETSPDIYYLYGQEMTKEFYEGWLVEMGIDINNITDYDKTIIDLKWNNL